MTCPARLASEIKTLLTYTGIRVRDKDRSTRFYPELLGLVPSYQDHTIEETGSRAAMLRHPRACHQLELNRYSEGGQFEIPFVASESLDHLGVRVEDVPALLESAERLGGKVHDMRPYRNFPCHKSPEGSTVGYVETPDGNILEV